MTIRLRPSMSMSATAAAPSFAVSHPDPALVRTPDRIVVDPQTGEPGVAITDARKLDHFTASAVFVE
jgi:hypothetical protein